MANPSDFTFGMAGLPHPEIDQQFYQGVPARRLAAWFIDATVVFAIGLVATLVVGVFTLGVGFALTPLIWLGASFVYRTATLANRSATWGMRAMGIELRRGDGTRFDGLTAAFHAGLHLFFISSVVLQIVSIAMVLTTRYRQNLPDMILRTAAINCPAE
jgi:uncharacterized RDD family membrane protein YckC